MATMHHNFAGKMEHQFTKETSFCQSKIPPIANFQLIAKYWLCQNSLTYGIYCPNIKEKVIWLCETKYHLHFAFKMATNSL